MIRKTIRFSFLSVIACGLLYFPLFAEDTNTVFVPSEIPKENWKAFTSADGHYSISFPGTPEHTNIVVKTKQGNCKIIRDTVPVDFGMEFSVACYNYLSDSNKITPEQRFDAVRAGFASHASWKLEYEKDFKFGNYPAKDFLFSVGEDKKILGRMRIICGKEYVYQTQVIFHKGYFSKEDIKKFINSFSISEK